MTETLSDKIWKEGSCSCQHLNIKYIKQFIKDLKEEMGEIEIENKGTEDEHTVDILIGMLYRIIDKLAGEELTK